MSTTLNSRGNVGQGGFHRWTKLPLDDLPLIRPPKHHMLAHITGGLTKLYDFIKENKKDEPEPEEKVKDTSSDDTPKDENKNGPVDNGLCNNEESETGENNESVEKETEKSSEEEEKNNQNEKKDDEGGGEDKPKSEEKSDSEEKSKSEGKSETEEKSKPEKEPDPVEEMDEEEETTPYTDEEGEFSPEKGMPYLAGRYKYANILARGQSAIIIKVLDTFHNDKPLAIKVLHRVYKPIGSQEADILLELHRADPWLHVPFARLLNQFLYGPHYCLVFEYLSPTPLYNHYDQKDIREQAALPHIRDLTIKLLTVLGFLYKQNVIHADLKPENILLCKAEDLSSIMVVDFGNALRNTDEELSLYYSDFELQTLLYRAPEVMFGMKFSLEVDMWSLGCLLAECYLGEPLFIGKSKKEVLSKITALMGPFPKEFNDGEYSKEFADFVGRPMSRYQRLENLRKRLNDCKDSTFLMLVERLLTYIPDRRFTPFEAACHPFVACSTPFLYLTPSPGYIRYPTIILDMSTYPYLPGLPDDEDENSEAAISRKRLSSFSRYKRPDTSSQTQKEKESQVPTTNAGGGNSSGTTGAPGTGGNPVTIGAGKKDDLDAPKIVAIPKQGGPSVVQADGKTATRSDVKETLKSMGLRCEDFTISVYSREQAHAILRRQGVEVTPNNLPSREKLAAMAARGGFKNARSFDMQRMPHNMRGMPPTNTWPANPRHPSIRPPGRPPLSRPMHGRPPNMRAPNPRKTVQRYDQQQHRQQEEDDDDCVILDPPDMPKPSRASLPQQFQLMGTTVQVNRGAKRPNRPMMHQPLAKRANTRPMQYYHKEHEEYGAEASVQDTLKRLKNYNISITCRRNAGLGPRGPMDSESDLEDEGHMESDEEEEDMTKYLECQIGEIEDIPEHEIYDEDGGEFEDKDDVDYNPRGKKRKKSKSPRKGGRRPFDPSSMLEQGMMPEPEAEIPYIDTSLEELKDDDEAEMEDPSSSPKPDGENDEGEKASDPLGDEKSEKDNEGEGEEEDMEGSHKGEEEEENELNNKESQDHEESQDPEEPDNQEEEEEGEAVRNDGDKEHDQEGMQEEAGDFNPEDVGVSEDAEVPEEKDIPEETDNPEETPNPNESDMPDETNIPDEAGIPNESDIPSTAEAETKEDSEENVISKEMVEPQASGGGHDDDEIDDELENELLAGGDVGGDEGDLEEEL